MTIPCPSNQESRNTHFEKDPKIGIPTSKKTQKQALSLGIPLSDLDSYPVVDLAIDGADEVDSHLNLLKGQGAFLLTTTVAAKSSSEKKTWS